MPSETPSDAQTQFARALAQLGIEGIQANSPQAKGRVERANQTLQDRLVKGMRLLGLNDQASANAWLPTFMADFNRRFAVVPAVSGDAHVAYQGKADDVKRILSVQVERRLSKNLSCQYEGDLLQVKTQGQGLSLRGAKVCVHCHQDGRMELLWQGCALAFEKTIKPQKQHAPVDGKGVNARVEFALDNRGHTIPAVDHPWKKTASGTPEKRPLTLAQFQHPTGNLHVEVAPP